jgi:glycosyltransferase involved in cell wall biosynthesis
VRVHLVGNVCNSHYAIAKALRAVGVDAHVFLARWDQVCMQNRPESDDPELTGSYPEWIHQLRIPGEKLHRKTYIDGASLESIMDCDVIHIHGDYAPWVMQGSVPYVIHPHGDDFFRRPFERWQTYCGLPNPRYLGFADAVREAYRGASAIVMGAVDATWTRGYRELLDGQRIAPLPLCLDTARFCPAEDAPEPALVRALREQGHMVVFQAARQLWTPQTRAVHSSKGNDFFLRGVARAMREDACKVSLVLVDRADFDTGATKKLLGDLGLATRVHWIPPMPRHRLIAYYRAVDVVVDGLVAGGYGAAPLEAMACGSAVLMYIIEWAYQALIGEVPPVLNAWSEDTVRQRLAEGANDRDRLRETGLRAARFVRRVHAPEVLGPRYLGLYNAVLGRDSSFRFLGPEMFRAVPAPSWLRSTV